MFSLIYRNLHAATLYLELFLRCFSPCCIYCIFLVNCEILTYIKVDVHVNCEILMYIKVDFHINCEILTYIKVDVRVSCEILTYIEVDFHVNCLSYLSKVTNMNFTDGLQ